MEPRPGNTLLDDLVSPHLANARPQGSPQKDAVAIDEIVDETAIPQGTEAREEVARRRNISGE